MCPSPNNRPIIISFKGLSIVNLDLSSFDSRRPLAAAEAAAAVVIVDKFCEHTKLVAWLKEVIRSH